jgi:hypothetical protein
MRSRLSIPPRFQASALVALVGLTVVTCESCSSTTPTHPTTPTSLAATNLAGTWAGTAKVTWHEIDGGGGCSGPVTVTFAQRGSAVSATLPEVVGCLNEPLRFEGALKGNVLQGSIVFPIYTWPTSGQASEDHVTMAAMNVFWDLRR